MKHVVAALAATWQSCRARQIEDDLSASSPEVCDDEDETTIETGS